MGTPCYSGISKFFAIVLLGAAAAIAAIAVLSSPAAARTGGGGNAIDEHPWDTDNLVYTQGSNSYSAKNFRVPHHQYTGYATSTTASDAAKAACGTGGVADGFFQTDSAGRNDFPVLKKVSGEWEPSATDSKTSGCTAFVDAQLQMAERARGNGGYYLDSQGNLQKAVVASSRFLVAPASRVRTYATWGVWDLTTPYSTQGSTGIQRSGVGGRGFVSTADAVPTSVKAYGLDAFTLNSFTCSSVLGGLSRITGTPDYYLARTDNFQADREGSGSYARVSSPQPSGAWEPSAAALSADNERVIKTAGTYYRQRDGISIISIPYTRITWYAVVHFGVCNQNKFLLASQDRGSDSNMSALCPAGMHPRGQDGFFVIGASTGRTLSSLNNAAKARTADEYWCRSDVRYRLAYTAEEHSGHGPPPGITVSDDGDVFYAFGRSGCFYTAMSMSAGECEYAFPVPQCIDGGTARDFTETELGKHTIGAKFSPEDDGTTDCGVPVAPVLPSFTDDPCVVADIRVYENRTAGSDAEPGVPSSDRTLPVAGTRTAWNIAVTSPHIQTASPPRGTGDASGCADGSESRADHSSSPGAAERKQSPVPSYAASDRTGTAAPPNDADGDIDYTGAVRNMAHRYASLVAENTCSVKRAEADAELALLEAREAAFTKWLSDYKTAADTNASQMRGYSRASYQRGAELRVLRFNDNNHCAATTSAVSETAATTTAVAIEAISAEMPFAASTARER